VSSLRVRADAAAQVLVEDLTAPAADEADTHHLRRVLRLRDGERVVACDGRGAWRLCTIAARGSLEPAGEIVEEPPDGPPVSVWLPAVKGERAEWAVAKLTELGVDEIGLLACDRAVVRFDEGIVERVLGRWARVVREAACQSRRVRLPVVVGPERLTAAVDAGVARCDLEGDEIPEGVHALAVGPEGGWSDQEREAAPGSVGLASSVLRTETAAIAAGVLLVRSRGRRHADPSEAQ